MILKNERLRISLVSIIAGIIILVLKFLAYILTDSTALKSDALESVVNVVSAIFTFGAVIYAERPADESHPYGHGKIENFSAAFEGGLISLAAVLIFYEAVKSWFAGPRVFDLDIGILLNFGAGLMNGVLGWFLLTFGKKRHSKAIEADGHHVLSDFYTTLGLIGGLLVVRFTHLYWLDSILAGLVGLFLAFTGFKLVRESSSALLDEEDVGLVQKLVVAMNKVRSTDIIDVHALRTLRSGRHAHVDIHVAVPENYALDKAHDLVEVFGHDAMRDLGLEGEFHSHIDPCKRLYCKSCRVEPCTIRREVFLKTKPLTVETAIALAPVLD